jgi:hypothetical protein
MPNSPYVPSRPTLSPNMVRTIRRNLEREFLIVEAVQEFRRLQNLNINTFTRSTQALANSFARNVINGSHGNHAALQRALNLLPRVRRIAGGNRSPRAHRSATTIQARARGMAARKRAAARRTRLVVGPNGTYMVAVPNRR